MRLHSRGIFGLRQDLQQFIVGQEVESWEGRPLGLQVFAETFLDLVQELVTFLEVLMETRIGT